MKFRETLRYELIYQSCSNSTWFYFLLLLVLSYLMAATFFVDEPLAGGYFLNAPYTIARVSLLSFFFLGLLTLAPFAGNAASRDLETRMHPLLYSSPISKQVYLGGRFLAAFALGAIIIMAIPIGVLAAEIFPLEEAELLGPVNFSTYLSTYFLLLLPNTFFVVAFMFSVAVLYRRGMLSYLIAVITGIIVIASWQVIGSLQGNWTLANFTDPLGITFIQELKKAWSVSQKNTLLPGMEVLILLNRILWFVLSAGILLITYLGFNTSAVLTKVKKAGKKRKEVYRFGIENNKISPAVEVDIPQASKSFDFGTRLLQIFTITKDSFKLIALSWGWIALACMILFVLLTGSMWFTDYYGIPELPVTGHLLGTLENVKDHGIWFIIPLLIIYFTGELVWREREDRVNDIIDSSPVPAWISFAGKFTGMILALILTQFFLMMSGILLQITLGYYDFQIPVYLKILFGFRLVDYILLAVLAFALHVILNQKYLAHLIAVLLYLLPIFGPEFGIESGLLLYNSDPGWTYSDLRGLNPFLQPWLYYKMFWGAWALLLVVVTVQLWPRGIEKDYLKKFKNSIRQSNFRMKTVAGISFLLILILGSFIFYSTHMLYPESAFVETLDWKAGYEKHYEKYSKSPQPSPTILKLQVEIFPEEGSAEIKGSYFLVNKTGTRIDTLFLSTSPGVDHHKLSWSQPVRSQQDDEKHDFRMYILEKPIFPGDSLQLEFHINYNPKGFPNNGLSSMVVNNGTYFDDSWLPVIGYLNSRQIFGTNDRKAQGLKSKTFLESEIEFYPQQRVDYEVVISTDKGQTAVAPGKLLKSWAEGGRSYFQYATDNPVNHKSGFFSSDYKVYDEQWKSDCGQVVDIHILHHPEHTNNLDRMGKGVQASLNYLNRELGKYPHSVIRFVEVPGYNKGLFAYPTNIFYREGFALLKPGEDPKGIDIVFATVAHEVAHQWWGSQVSPSPVKGAALITESLSWYAAFEIIEEAQGKESFLTFLNMARDDYFSPQERAADPLLEAAQTSLIYRKGPLALNALREYIGKEKVRLGLLSFFRKYSTVNSERPVPSDLYRELQVVTPDSLQYLLHDLFATNTFWDLKTEKSEAKKTATGTWDVALDVHARKFTLDSLGIETNVPMNDWVQIGIYDTRDGKMDLQKPLYLQWHQLRSGKQTIKLNLLQKPIFAGIDPDNLLIDLKRFDHIIQVDL